MKLSSCWEFLVWFNYNLNAPFIPGGQIERMAKVQPVKI